MNGHQRPTDRRTLPAAETSKSRRDRSRTITRTRRRTRQLYAGPTQPYPRRLTTSHIAALWASKEVHPRPTERRSSTEATSSATRRDRNKHHRTDPSRRLREACCDDGTVACSAVHSRLSGVSRIVSSATHRRPSPPPNLAVVSPSARRLLEQQGSCTVRYRISVRSSTRGLG